MDSDEVKTYFELNCAVGEDMDTVQCVCSKTYARGLIFITIYFEGTFYVSISDGYGDQPLLDVRFPDVSNHGEGITLMSYLDNDIEARWQKLTLWQSLAEEMKVRGWGLGVWGGTIWAAFRERTNERTNEPSSPSVTHS